MDVDIRAERPSDVAAVAALLRSAFGEEGGAVAAMVQALRSGPTYVPELALVATDGAGAVVGFVMVTTLDLEAEPYQRFSASTSILCLSPLAVAEGSRGRGMGGALVRAALARAGGRAEPYVVLEGDPAYYSRLGFVAAQGFGLRSPSQRIPHGAFQAYRLHGGHTPRGRVLYSRPFWEIVTPGLPFAGVPWLDELERHCRGIEAAVAGFDGGPSGGLSGGPSGGRSGAALGVAVPTCPGWTVGDVLVHLGIVARVVVPWLHDNRRPRTVELPPERTDPVQWFGSGWRALHETLGERAPDAPTSTWSPHEATVGFWQRKQVHEHGIHALDVATALGSPWSVPDAVALDGIDEVVRLWLGNQVGNQVGGDGCLVRLAATTSRAERPEEFWSVGLHAGVMELHRLDVPPDAAVRADPVTLYRWLWGRAPDAEVVVDGDPAAVAVLRGVLARALQ